MLARLRRCAAEVRERSNRSLLSIALEMARLRLGPGRLGVSEYLAFGLHARDDLSLEEKKEFAGWRVENAINLQANPVHWRVLTHDKIVFYAFARGCDLPYPSIAAIFHPGGRIFPGARTLSAAHDVVRYLRDPAVYPFFGKPCHGGFGRGVIAAASLAPDGESIRTSNDERISVEEAARIVTRHADHGYIFQEAIRPDPRLLDVTAGQLSTLRVVVMLGRGRAPHVEHCNWKVPRVGNPVSNYVMGGLGNVVAILDPTLGRVDAAYSPHGESLELLDANPDSGASLKGVVLPDWARILELIDRAARCVSGVRLQYWDVALSDAGPLLLEVNSTGELFHLQSWPVPRRGFLNPETQAYLREWGAKPSRQ